MSTKLTKKEKTMLKHQQQRKKAPVHAAILLAILLIPFLSHERLFTSGTPEATRPENVDYRISMVGDMMFGRHVEEHAVMNGLHIDYVFDYVRPFFAESDYVTGNLESPIVDAENPEIENQMENSALRHKDIHLHALPWAIDALEGAHFNSVSLANNHSLDYGDLSLYETLEHFEGRDVEIVGIGHGLDLSFRAEREGLKDASGISYYDISDDFRVAVIGITDSYVRGFDASENVGGVFTSPNMDLLANRMIEAKTPRSQGGGDADVLIIHIHWGNEYQVRYNENQRGDAQFMADNGADIIIGHHPHVLQSVSILQGRDPVNDHEDHETLVMYSLGNFVFDQGWTTTKESTIAQLDFLSDGSKQISFIPLWIENATPRETSGLLKPYRDRRIFRMLTKDIDEEIYSVSEGRLVIDLEKTKVLQREGD